MISTALRSAAYAILLFALPSMLFRPDVPDLVGDASKFGRETTSEDGEEVHFNFTDNLARPFRSMKEETWCTSDYSRSRPTGLLYNKMPKAASSTAAGIGIRIANNYALRRFGRSTPCDAKVDKVQGYSAGKIFGRRDVDRSYLFSTLRDPAKRAVSRVFFTKVSRGRGEPTDRNVLGWLEGYNSNFGAVSPGMGGFQLAYLSFDQIEKWSAWTQKESSKVQHPSRVHDTVRRIMSDYDLLMVVERFDESLVAMQLLLGLDVTDILYLPSKTAGNYHYATKGRNKDTCVKLAPAKVTDRVQRYLSSPEWYAKNYGDYVLMEAARQSLDLTIDALGRERFDGALTEFLKLKHLATEKCAERAVFPCSKEGKVQVKKSKESCYEKDHGCGYDCLDTFSGKKKTITTK